MTTQTKPITKQLLQKADPDSVLLVSTSVIGSLTRFGFVCCTFVDGEPFILSPSEFAIDESILRRMSEDDLIQYLVGAGLDDDAVATRVKELLP